MNKSDYNATVSLALTNILLDYMQRIGIDSHQLCDSVGIDLSGFKDGDERLGVEKFAALWASAVQKAGDPDFGLNSIMDATIHYPGGHILFSVVLNCPTVYEAMQKFFRYHDLMNDVVKPGMELDTDVFYVTWTLFDGSHRLPRHISEALLFLYYYILSTLTQNRLELIEVRFAHKKPADISKHQALFQAPLRFEQPRNELVVKREYLDFPLFWSNPELLDTLERFAEKRMEKINPEKLWSDKTIHLLNVQIAKGEKITIQSIAESLGLSIRNLQNRLKEEGNTFQGVYNDLRKEIACQYLKEDDTSILDITFLLGFSEQSAFNHAFKRWTGTTPREYVKMYC